MVWEGEVEGREGLRIGGASVDVDARVESPYIR